MTHKFGSGREKGMQTTKRVDLRSLFALPLLPKDEKSGSATGNSIMFRRPKSVPTDMVMNWRFIEKHQKASEAARRL